jgi:hypothetical protein
MPTPDEQYSQAVNEQKNYLQQLQTAFNEHCDQITAEAQKQLSSMPATAIQEKQAIMEDQKKKLTESLAQLKSAIELSANKNRRKLEEIHSVREIAKLAELEQIMAQFQK